MFSLNQIQSTTAANAAPLLKATKPEGLQTLPPTLDKLVAICPPEQHADSSELQVRPANFQRMLVGARNEIARKRFSEDLQFGIHDPFAVQMADMKAFLVSKFSEAGAMFTAHKIETLISTIVALNESNNALSKIAIITLCLNSLSGRAVSVHVVKFLQDNYRDFVPDSEDLQSSEVRNLLDNWDRLNDSQFIDKIRNVASYCMAFSVLENMGMPDTVAEIVYAEFKVQKKTKQVTSFIHAILDAVEFTCSRMLVCVKEGNLTPLLHTTSTYTRWFDQTQKLEKWTSMLTCDPETLEFSFQEYEKELIDCIALGQNFTKHAKSNTDRKTMTVIVNRLELFLADYQTRHIVGKTRLMPFGLSVYGDSSVGKSSFADLLFAFSAKCLNQKDDPEYMYTRNFRDPFWSGFKSHKWFILLDDVGSVKPSAANGTDPSVDEIISLMNTVSLLCNMADLSEKGRVAARPLVVVATTNHPWMNVHHYSYHPSALMRRFPYRVTVKVNEAHQVEAARTMLDPNKCNVDYSTSYPDFWDITVDKVLAAPLPTDGSSPPCEPILVRELTDVGMKDFLPWYRQKLLAHMASQKDIKSKMATMAQVKICEHHVPIGNCGICENLQFGPRSMINYECNLTFKEQFIAFFLFLYFWIFAGMQRDRAHINAYRRAIPALRVANSATRGVDYVSRFNPFAGLSDMVLQVPNLPTRQDISKVAENFYKHAMENKKYIALTATIAVAAALIKFLRTAEALQFSFLRPVPQDEKKAAKWTSDSIHLSPLTLSRQTKSMKGLDTDQVTEIVARNVVAITLYHCEGKALDNCMFAIGGNIFAINKHVLDLCPHEFRMDCIFMPSVKAGTRNSSIKFSKDSIRKVIDDIAIVEINNFPPFAKLDYLLPSKGFDVRAHGKYIKRNTDGNIICRDALNVTKGTSNLLGSEGYWSDCSTVSGDCGSPLITFTSYGPVIMGIHSAAKVSLGRAFCSKLYKEDIDDLIIIDSGVVSLQSDDKQIQLYPVINRKDPVLFLEESTCAVYGTLSTGTSSIKSNVRKTGVAEFFESKGWITTHEKPNLGTWLPWSHAMGDMSKPKLLVSSAEAEWLADKTLSHHFMKLPQGELDLIMIFDIQTAVSGAPGVNYVNSLAMNTSLGFPWRKPKRNKISFDPESGVFTLDDELNRRVEDMIDRYRQGERCNPIFCASEKDEARAAEKNKLGKIRLFMGAPVDFVVVMRMFFGSLIRVVQRNPSNFECAVGINAHSKEWHTLATDLLSFGDHCLFDGDYQSYDKLMESVLIYSAIVAAGNQMIKHMQDKCGFTTRELQLIYRSIAHDVAFAYIDFNGTLVSFLRNHVSGEPLTVIINCFVGSMYVRYAYKQAMPDDQSLDLFCERIKLRTYGDDNVLAVNPTVIDKFNFRVMQEKLAEIGVVYTRADKLPGSYTTKSLSEIDFLKRGFVYNEDLGRYTGPLAKSSIEKSFLIGLCSKSITQEERDLATMNSGLREFFFHGREVYNINRNLILECCETLGMKYNPKNFPTYDYYLDLYMNSDIVHFQFYQIEEDDNEEEVLQSGEIYTHSGTDKSLYFPIEMDGEFAISTTFGGDFSVTHVAFMKTRQLQYFIKELGKPFSSTGRFLVKAKFLRLRAKWNKEYRRALLEQMHDKLFEHLHNHYVWRIAQSVVTPGQWVTRDEWVNPLPYQDYKGMFRTNEVRNSSSSITVVPTSRLVGVIEDFSSDVSSGDTEHCLQQDKETFQSSEEVILSFADEAKGEVGNIGSGIDSTRNTSVFKDAAISHFLERPVLISTSTWTENANINLVCKPFYEFFNDPHIKNKITNYSLLRCNLKIKVMINASPFYYGLAKAVWKPLIRYNPDTYVEVSGQDGWKVPYSQIPGFYIHVEKNEGGEMTLPFFYPKNWLSATSKKDMEEIGTLNIRSFTPLRNANSVSSSDVTIQIYAWAENIELSGPTISEALQAGDEYTTNGPVSGPASAVASAAGALSKIPILKPYAKATEMVSSSLADVARYFGFTNVANLQSEVPQHPGAFLGMASTNLMTPYESLTIDDKNELSIDPRIAGIRPTDELMISNFCSRESWIWQSNWSSSQSADTLLFVSRVLPELIRNEGGSVYRQATPMAHINRMFNYWRGDIKFRFKFICSKYHRGRIRITYDPDASLHTYAVTSTTSVTRIVDIAEESDVEITVPYMQALSFLSTMAGKPSFEQNMNGGTAAVTRDANFDNGQISVRVFTKQTSPVADADIIMQVFVSAPDIEFAGPCEVPKDYSFEKLQSGSERSVVSTNVDNQDSHMYQVHFGERIMSLRQLFRRKNFYCTAQLQSSTDLNDTSMTLNSLTLPRLPVPYGFAPKGGFKSPGITVPDTQFPANYVANTPLSLLMPCFVGVTGSMVYSINVDSPFQSGSIYAARGYESYTSTTNGFKPKVNSSYISSSHGSASYLSYRELPTGPSGRVLTNQYTQAGLTFKVPMYSNRRFLATSQNNVQDTTKVDGTELDTFTTVVWTKPNGHSAVEKSTQIQYYYMAGADFNLLYFRNIPTMYVYNLPAPTA